MPWLVLLTYRVRVCITLHKEKFSWDQLSSLPSNSAPYLVHAEEFCHFPDATLEALLFPSLFNVFSIFLCNCSLWSLIPSFYFTFQFIYHVCYPYNIQIPLRAYASSSLFILNAGIFKMSSQASFRLFSYSIFYDSFTLQWLGKGGNSSLISSAWPWGNGEIIYTRYFNVLVQ